LSKRNGLPKPNASERTWRRFRERHDIETVEDKQHFSKLEKLKELILYRKFGIKYKTEEEQAEAKAREL
jgi:hypothetical protein